MENIPTIPYFGKETAESSLKVESGNGNFMWHKMTAYQWFHQSVKDINATIKELESIRDTKVELLSTFRILIEEFDWSHMYSDDSKPTTRQKERNKEFNELLKVCPGDLTLTVYGIFIKAYIDYAVHGTAPISYETFLKGIDI